jgi:hypothetical protein
MKESNSKNQDAPNLNSCSKISREKRLTFSSQKFGMTTKRSKAYIKTDVKDLIRRKADLHKNEYIKLNRLILESVYPLKCPKTSDRSKDVSVPLLEIDNLKRIIQEAPLPDARK